MRHEMLTQHAPFCGTKCCPFTKKGMLSQHFVTHVIPPLSYVHELAEVEHSFYGPHPSSQQVTTLQLKDHASIHTYLKFLSFISFILIFSFCLADGKTSSAP